MSRPWTEPELQVLREKYGMVPNRNLVGAFGRSVLAIKQRARKEGLIGIDRRYKPEQLELVRKMYFTHNAMEIAEKVFGSRRSAGAIWRLAHKLGLRKWPSWPPAVIARVKALNARGLGDYEIMQKMPGVFQTQDQVRTIRRERLKLGPMPAAALQRAKRRGVENQLKTLGLTSPTQLRTRAYQRFAIDCGWPADLRPREVQILNLLAERGPMERRAIHVAIGMNPNKAARNLLNCAGSFQMYAGSRGSYTANLIHRGLVIGIKRYQKTGRRGFGRLKNLYTLTAAAIAMIEARVKREQESGSHGQSNERQSESVGSAGAGAETVWRRRVG